MAVGSAFWGTGIRDPRVGLDGAEWILEARIGQNYHFVNRWSPDDGLVHDIGMQFIQMSGGKFGEIY
jgi:hypothetical protein